jgi:hypothetical protein
MSTRRPIVPTLEQIIRLGKLRELSLGGRLSWINLGNVLRVRAGSARCQSQSEIVRLQNGRWYRVPKCEYYVPILLLLRGGDISYGRYSDWEFQNLSIRHESVQLVAQSEFQALARGEIENIEPILEPGEALEYFYHAYPPLERLAEMTEPPSVPVAFSSEEQTVPKPTAQDSAQYMEEGQVSTPVDTRAEKEQRIAQYVAKHPSHTSPQVAKATGIPEQTVRNTRAWRERPNKRRLEPCTGRSIRQISLNEKILASTANGAGDPSEIVAEREIIERQYLENATPEKKAEYHGMTPEDKTHTLTVWNEYKIT